MAIPEAKHDYILRHEAIPMAADIAGSLPNTQLIAPLSAFLERVSASKPDGSYIGIAHGVFYTEREIRVGQIMLPGASMLTRSNILVIVNYLTPGESLINEELQSLAADLRHLKTKPYLLSARLGISAGNARRRLNRLSGKFPPGENFKFPSGLEVEMQTTRLALIEH